MAGKSWGAADIGTRANINNSHMNHRGTSSIGGGDWGITGSPHPECVAQDLGTAEQPAGQMQSLHQRRKISLQIN